MYGMLKAASQFGNQAVFLRVVQNAMFRKFLATSQLGLRPGVSPIEACRTYTGFLTREGIVEAGDASFGQRDERIVGEIGESCPYRQTCTWVHEEGMPVYCFRAAALAEMLRITTKQVFEPRLEAFAIPCRIALAPTHMEVSVDGDEEDLYVH